MMIKSTNFVRSILCAIAGSILLSSPVFANDTEAADSWNVRVAPYLWAAGLEGSVKPFRAAPETAVDLSFGDIFDKLDFAAMLAVQARKDRFIIRSDASYVSLSASTQSPDPNFTDADVSSKTFQAMLAGGYQVFRSESAEVDLFAGARLWSVRSKLDLSGPSSQTTFEKGKTFVDPILGASAELKLAPDISLGISATAGGFGIAADEEYSTTAAVEWQAGQNWGLAAGYHYLAVDYRENGFIFDVEESGPFISAFIDF